MSRPDPPETNIYDEKSVDIVLKRCVIGPPTAVKSATGSHMMLKFTDPSAGKPPCFAIKDVRVPYQLVHVKETMMTRLANEPSYLAMVAKSHNFSQSNTATIHDDNADTKTEAKIVVNIVASPSKKIAHFSQDAVVPESKTTKSELMCEHGSEKLPSDNGNKNTMYDRLWFTWKGKYTSGKIRYSCQEYITAVTLTAAAATHYYEDYGERGGKPHTWMVNKPSTTNSLRFGRPIGLLEDLQTNCISKSEMLVHMREMWETHQCHVPVAIKKAKTHDLFFHDNGNCHYDENWYHIHNLMGILHELREAEKLSLEAGVDCVDHHPPVYHKSSKPGEFDGMFHYRGPCDLDCPRCALERS